MRKYRHIQVSEKIYFTHTHTHKRKKEGKRKQGGKLGKEGR